MEQFYPSTKGSDFDIFTQPGSKSHLFMIIIIVIMKKTNLIILGNHLAGGLMPPPVTFLATFAAVTGLK